MGEIVVAPPEVTVMLPGVITPVPPENVGVSVVEFPDVMVEAPAVRDVAVGAATTVTVAEAVDWMPPSVTVSTYVVVTLGETE